MIDKKEYKSLMEIVIADQMPESSRAFKRTGDTLIDKLYAGENIRILDNQNAETEFIAETTAILTLITLLATTYQALMKCWEMGRAARKEITNSDLSQQLSQQLIESGVPPEKVGEIISKFWNEALKKVKDARA